MNLASEVHLGTHAGPLKTHWGLIPQFHGGGKLPSGNVCDISSLTSDAFASVGMFTLTMARLHRTRR